MGRRKGGPRRTRRAPARVFGEPMVLLEGEDFIAVSKPAGLKMHPANDDGAPDLVQWLDATHPGLRPVHRLDRETSGVVLCAAEGAPRATLSTWFTERKVEKHYLALVFGLTPRKARIGLPLDDARRGRALSASTSYRRVESFGRFTLLELRPHTGRKHQLRRHLHAKGFPVVGDRRYKQVPFRRVPAFPGRLWLHAARLVLPDGTEVEAPLPPELAEHLDWLRANPPEPDVPAEEEAQGAPEDS